MKSSSAACSLYKTGNPTGVDAEGNPFASVHPGEFDSSHCDASRFYLLGGGPALIRNAGYERWNNRFHNTLPGAGCGPKGRRNPAVPKEWPLTRESRSPRMLLVESAPQADCRLGDATVADADASGKRAAQRDPLFIKTGVLVLLDRVSANSPRSFTIRFWPEIKAVRQPEGGYMSTKTGIQLGLDARSLEDGMRAAATLPSTARSDVSPNLRPASSLTPKNDTGTTVDALSCSAPGRLPRLIKRKQSGTRAILRFGGQAGR
jgi:hypothetical protein